MKKPLKLTTYQLLIVRFCMNIYVCQKRVEFYAPTNFFIYIYIYVEQVKKTNSSSNNFFHICWAKKNYENFISLNLNSVCKPEIPCVSRFPSFKIDNKNISCSKTRSARKKSESLERQWWFFSAFFLGGKCPSPLKRGDTWKKEL